jgi:hypothetical protein
LSHFPIYSVAVCINVAPISWLILYPFWVRTKSLKIPKGEIRNCKSRNRKHNGQKKKDKRKRTNNDIQNTTQKTKDWVTWTRKTKDWVTWTRKTKDWVTWTPLYSCCFESALTGFQDLYFCISVTYIVAVLYCLSLTSISCLGYCYCFVSMLSHFLIYWH